MSEEHKRATQVHRMTKSLQPRAEKPTGTGYLGGCWGLVPCYTGQLFGPSYVKCTKSNRSESKLCHWHKHFAGDLDEDDRGPLDQAWIKENDDE